jgi:diguanylate cyclase (GGDEF)-like protein
MDLGTAAPGDEGHHFSCSLTAVLLARVHGFGGDEAVARLLREAGSRRSPEYLSDIANWISFDEAVALWSAGAAITRHPQFARAVGEDAARHLNASPVAALLRSLGSPEAIYGQIALTTAKFNVATTMEALDVASGRAVLEARSVPGFPRSIDHCAWTCGLLTQPTVLFGLPPATVAHEQCEALGAESCRYTITWPVDDEHPSGEPGLFVEGLQAQLDAMHERMHSMFATASDLIGTDDLGGVLARITDRAAVEVRAPRYLLTVRTAPGEPAHCHHKGFDAEEAQTTAQRILEEPLESLPESWLVVPVRSRRCDYGRLLAMYPPGQRFFPQERELFEVYARYAASALDSATALMEAKRRAAHSSALLDLARALAAAGTSDEVARRLADAVPMVVDCDRVSVYLWDPREAVLRLGTSSDSSGAETGIDPEVRIFTPSPGSPLQQWLDEPSAGPVFVDADSGHPVLRELAARVEAVASITVPLATGGSLLGLLVVWVTSDGERLEPTPDLLDRISGVAAQATTALQNGRLVDEMTHQTLHDQLTGLANRMGFSETLRGAIERARRDREPLELFYIDLDGFKPVNDEFGHEIGDHLLVAVGERLRGCTRAADTVARLGGDEFALLLHGHGADPEGERLQERLMAALDAPFRIGGHELRLGASIGRAVFPVDGEDAEALLRRSDAAMFAEKRARYAMRRGDGAPPVAAR